VRVETEGSRTSEYRRTGSVTWIGFGVLLVGIAVAIAGGLGGKELLALVGLGFAFLGAALMAVATSTYARSRALVKAPPNRMINGRM
jgi:drug/metabolite transporter (DMT)-like permease